MITPEKLKELEEKLRAEKKTIQEQIASHDKVVSFGDDKTDPEDEGADEAEEFANNQAIVQDLRNRYNEIEDALNKIKSGTYGMCVKCGKPIESEILENDPASSVCRADHATS